MTISKTFKRQIIDFLSNDSNLNNDYVFVSPDIVDKVEKYYIIFRQKYIKTYGQSSWNTFLSDRISTREQNIQNNKIDIMLAEQKRILKQLEHQERIKKSKTK